MNSLGSGVDVIVDEGGVVEIGVGNGKTMSRLSQAVKKTNKIRMKLFNEHLHLKALRFQLPDLWVCVLSTTETNAVVDVAGSVAPIRRTDVVVIIVPRAAPQHTILT